MSTIHIALSCSTLNILLYHQCDFITLVHHKAEMKTLTWLAPNEIDLMLLCLSSTFHDIHACDRNATLKPRHSTNSSNRQRAIPGMVVTIGWRSSGRPKPLVSLFISFGIAPLNFYSVSPLPVGRFTLSLLLRQELWRRM